MIRLDNQDSQGSCVQDTQHMENVSDDKEKRSEEKVSSDSHNNHHQNSQQ